MVAKAGAVEEDVAEAEVTVEAVVEVEAEEIAVVVMQALIAIIHMVDKDNLQVVGLLVLGIFQMTSGIIMLIGSNMQLMS